MNIQTILRPITWLTGMRHGYACGYVGVPESHPWHGKSDMELPDIVIHGGVTWSDGYITDDKGVQQPNPENLWWIGFDTAHGGDNEINCDKQYCEEQLASLLKQAEEAVGK